MREIEITREAVCAADDQSNPLSMTLELPDRASLKDLMKGILARDFLQFASSAITGYADERPIVKVHPNNSCTFLIPSSTPIKSCLADGELDFRWDWLR